MHVLLVWRRKLLDRKWKGGCRTEDQRYCQNSVSPGDDGNMEAIAPLKKCKLSSSLQRSFVVTDVEASVICSADDIIEPSCEASVLNSQDSPSLVSGCRPAGLREQKEELFYVDHQCTESETLVLGTVSLGVSSSCILQKEKSAGSVSLPRSERINLEDVRVEISTSTCAGCIIEPEVSSQSTVARTLENGNGGFVSSSIGFESVTTADDRGPCADDNSSHLFPKSSTFASQIPEGSCSPRTTPKRPAAVQETPGAPVKARIERPPPNLRLLGRVRRKLLFDDL